MGIFDRLFQKERLSDTGSLMVPAELWSDFGEVLYILSNQADSHVVNANMHPSFSWRATGIDVASDNLVVKWSIEANGESGAVIKEFLMNRIDEINENAERPIEIYNGYSSNILT